MASGSSGKKSWSSSKTTPKMTNSGFDFSRTMQRAGLSEQKLAYEKKIIDAPQPSAVAPPSPAQVYYSIARFIIQSRGMYVRLTVFEHSAVVIENTTDITRSASGSLEMDPTSMRSV